MAVSLARPREEGYLVLADITGYTSFLTRTELEHAHGIVAELTALVIAKLAAPLRFVELEGDAVFAYAPASAFADAERLIDMMEMDGLVSAAVNGKREVLVDRSYFDEVDAQVR